jgi:hypothetical protein
VGCRLATLAMRRLRHPRKELEQVLRDAEAVGWQVTKARKYFALWCPCGEHKKWVHLTPSDPRYERNLRKWLKRQPCWREQ